MATKLDEKTWLELDFNEDEGPFVRESDAEARQDWLESTYDMGFRVVEYNGEFWCCSSLRLPRHLLDE